MLPDAGTGVGVAQIHGCVCEPSRIGPPRTWFVIVRLAHGPAVAVAVGVGDEGVLAGHHARRARRARCASLSSATNEAPTSAPLSVSVTFFIGTVFGTCTSTSASPSLIRSARLRQRADLEVERWKLRLRGRHPRVGPVGHRHATPAESRDRQQSDAERTDPHPVGQTHDASFVLEPSIRNRFDANAPTAAPAGTLTSVTAPHNYEAPP